MNNEIRDLILSAFSLRYMGHAEPKEGETERNLNHETFYFVPYKDKLIIGRMALGSDTRFEFDKAKLSDSSLECDITVTFGNRKIVGRNLVFYKNEQYSLLFRLKRHLLQTVRQITDELYYVINDFEKFTLAFEGKLDSDLFDFIEEVKIKFHQLEYRNTNPTELVSYTTGIPTLNFSRNDAGEITVAVASFVDDKNPYLLVGDDATISNIRLCIKNEFGAYKRERLKSIESDMNRTLTRLDHIDAQ